IQQYLQHKHYALWEVIEFGDSYEVPKEGAATGSTSDGKKGRTIAVTTEDMQKRRNDVKVRTTLLFALLDEHQLRFSKYKMAQELWAAILKTFCRNEATRKMKKNLLKQQYGNFNAEEKETLAPEWLMHTIVWRNRSDLDTMSLDELYNHLKVYESEINEDDIEEMDIKWNMALLSMRADRYWKKTRKKISVQGTDVASFDKSKGEFNTDFHQMVDFIAASPLRYALTINPTVYVSHIRQFWSTARIETTDEGIKILATVDGKPRTISESSIRRNLKLRDEAGISSLLDSKLFESLTLMGYNSLPNRKFSFQKGQFSHQWKYLIHTCLSFSGWTVSLFESMLVTMGEGSGTPTEPHHTPSPEAQQTLPIATSSPSLPPITTKSIPTVIPTNTPQLRQYTRRAKIAQSSALPPVADEPASPTRDDSQGKVCLTDSGLEAEQDRANITMTSTLPSDSTPRVTSIAADEGSMQQKLIELMDLCTRLQRQQDEMASKITAQDLEISQLNARVKLLEDRNGGGIAQSGEDSPIKGKSLDEGEEAEVTTVSVPPATIGVLTDSGMVLTASPIFTTATESTPTQEEKEKKRW
nr:ribonuclease H-like domain-containing protein [Tanacetum cinerariifolium]